MFLQGEREGERKRREEREREYEKEKEMGVIMEQKIVRILHKIKKYIIAEV